MRLTIASIAGRSRAEHFDELVAGYIRRIAPYAQAESLIFRTGKAFFDSIERQRARASSALVLLDSRGRRFSSEDLAAWLGRQRDEGRQRIVFAVGPAEGWSNEERARATLLLSLGPMTLAHELARLVLSEQVYRAFTILAGHPYHSGH